MLKQVKRGEIYYADLNPIIGSEQGGLRPVLIIQNDKGNQHSPTVIIAAITGKPKKEYMPTQYYLPAGCGLEMPSKVMLEQIRTIDKSRLRQRVGMLGEKAMAGVDRAIAFSVGVKYGG